MRFRLRLALNGVVDGWWLDLGELEAAAVVAVVQAYKALQRGEISPAMLLGDLALYAGAGFFSGHLRKGSRELDRLKSLAPDPSILEVDA